MTNYSSDNQNHEGLFSRRRMLSALGVAGLSTVSATVVAHPQAGQKQMEKGTCFIYSSVMEMKQDRSLKAGDCVETKGYHEAGDGGHAKYQVVKSPAQKAHGGEFVSLSGSLCAQLINVDRVNYKMFGAKSDGKNDDGEQIKMAHDYANKYDIPVENSRGEFWIIKANDINIQTNIQWGTTIFHIDERYNTRTPRIKVTERQESVKIHLSEGDKRAVLDGLKAKDNNIPALARYANSLIVIVDTNDKAVARQGGSSRGTARSKQDFFVVEEFGRILGDVLDFNDYTSLTVYPAAKSYLTVEGGTFLLSGHSSELMDNGYMLNGIQVTRSRTIVKNQWVGLEPGKRDIAMLARSGFYAFSRAYDLQLKNIRQIPYEKTRATKETTVPQGTYGISCNTIMNAFFSNITADAGSIHWGVFGTNHVKNIKIERCVFNRFDVHSFGWNISIKDSHIGEKGITVTGGGELRVENSSSRGVIAFITLRNDYGSRWDGDIVVKNCRYYASGPRGLSLLRYGNRDLNYMYEIGYARSITIENMEIDYQSEPTSTVPFWLISLPTIESYTNSGKLFFPTRIELKNISVKGREQGVRVMRVSSPDSYILPKKFSYDGSFLSCNAKIVLENIQLEQSELGGAHLAFDQPKGKLAETSLVPFVRVKDCENVVCDMGSNMAEVVIEDSIVDYVNLGDNEKYEGALTFMNCKFRPSYSKDKVFKWDAVLGTSFVNCQLFLPQSGETPPEEDLLSIYGFMEINGSVRFNHLGTRLGNDLLAYLKSRNIQLTPEFIGRLKAHHELEE